MYAITTAWCMSKQQFERINERANERVNLDRKQAIIHGFIFVIFDENEDQFCKYGIST